MTAMITAPKMEAHIEPAEFKPIADYGLLSDCTTSALVARDGSVDWLCLPRFDGPAVFARILDPEAGHWSIRPAGEFDGRTPLRRRHARDRDDVHDASAASVRLRDALALRRGPAQPRHRPRRAARAAALGGGRLRLGASSSWSSRRGPSTGSCARCCARPRTAGARSAARTRSPSAPASRPRSTERRCARASPSRRATRVGFALRWIPAEAQEPPEPTAPDARRRPHRRHRRGVALVGGRPQRLRRPLPRPACGSARACSRA